MEPDIILGVDIHEAVMGLKRAVGMRRLKLRSTSAIRELDIVRFGADGKVNPSTVASEVRALARAYIASHPDDWMVR